jgi:hypothetical protein
MEKQEKFDAYMKNKRRFMLTASYIVIILLVFEIVKQLFFAKTI